MGKHRFGRGHGPQGDSFSRSSSSSSYPLAGHHTNELPSSSYSSSGRHHHHQNRYYDDVESKVIAVEEGNVVHLLSRRRDDEGRFEFICSTCRQFAGSGGDLPGHLEGVLPRLKPGTMVRARLEPLRRQPGTYRALIFGLIEQPLHQNQPRPIGEGDDDDVEYQLKPGSGRFFLAAAAANAPEFVPSSSVLVDDFNVVSDVIDDENENDNDNSITLLPPLLDQSVLQRQPRPKTIKFHHQIFDSSSPQGDDGLEEENGKDKEIQPEGLLETTTTTTIDPETADNKGEISTLPRIGKASSNDSGIATAALMTTIDEEELFEDADEDEDGGHENDLDAFVQQDVGQVEQNSSTAALVVEDHRDEISSSAAPLDDDTFFEGSSLALKDQIGEESNSSNVKEEVPVKEEASLIDLESDENPGSGIIPHDVNNNDVNDIIFVVSEAEKMAEPLVETEAVAVSNEEAIWNAMLLNSAASLFKDSATNDPPPPPQDSTAADFPLKQQQQPAADVNDNVLFEGISSSSQGNKETLASSTPINAAQQLFSNDKTNCNEAMMKACIFSLRRLLKVKVDQLMDQVEKEASLQFQ